MWLTIFGGRTYDSISVTDKHIKILIFENAHTKIKYVNLIINNLSDRIIQKDYTIFIKYKFRFSLRESFT